MSNSPGQQILASRTPLRISLFGGGTDYPEWFERNPGAVLGFTIDKYIYISAMQIGSFVDYRYRVGYSRVETVQSVDEIEHPVVRAVLEREHFLEPTDYSIQADLPAKTGLGSSSAFTTGLLNLIATLKGSERPKLELARLAIDTEHNVLGERVGIQDQLHASFGGVNRFDFEGDDFTIKPMRVSGEDLALLADWMVLVYTGITRSASETLDDQIANTSSAKIDHELRAMVELVDHAESVLAGTRGETLVRDLAELLGESWELKKRFSEKVTTPQIDALYDRCLDAGALAGKLCGAGSGGFLLMVIPPAQRGSLIDAVGEENCVDFRIEHQGSLVRSLW